MGLVGAQMSSPDFSKQRSVDGLDDTVAAEFHQHGADVDKCVAAAAAPYTFGTSW